jgi:hypothetical protein
VEQVMTTERTVEFGVLVDHVVNFVVDRVITEFAKRLGGSEQVEPAEPAELAPALVEEPADLRYADDPAAVEEPRKAQGLPLDISGFVFDEFTAVERSRPGYWHVRCSCGICKEVSREALRLGSARSCGCARLGLGPLRANTRDLMGQRFGNLKVVGRARPQHQITSWRCRCQCGRFAEYRADMLRSGKRVSCGCAEKVTQFAPGNVIGQATQIRPGSNLSPGDERVRDDLLAQLRARGTTTDGAGFTPPAEPPAALARNKARSGSGL